jgi:hypothetical protein
MKTRKKIPEFLYKRARKEVSPPDEEDWEDAESRLRLRSTRLRMLRLKNVWVVKAVPHKITSPSGKVYVGQTIQEFNIRIKSHHRKDSGCTAISRAIQKYKDQMKYEIIEDNVPQEQLDDREIYWIKELNSLAPNGYNLNTGGQFFK